MKQTTVAAVVLSVVSAFFPGCGTRRSTTVDPLPDPVFRQTGQVPRYRRHSPGQAGGSGRTYRASRLSRPEPWAVSSLSSRWKYIIVHHSATKVGGAERIGRTHRRPKSLGGRGMDELGYHFVIGNGTDTPDGKIEVGSRWIRQKHGAHCRVRGDSTNRYNRHGIGICLVGNFEYSRPSAAQMRSLVYLTNGLLGSTGLAKSAVHFHKDFKNTKCPGRRFPYSTYKRGLRG